jgi:membrane-bound inhibitor of C-type lysozyme
MKNLFRIGVLGTLTALTCACATDGPVRTGTTYSCSAGTKLRVNYLADSAIVSVNGARGIPFRQTPSTSGAVYENGARRLARTGNTVTWNTAQRTTPETCRVINTIN